MSETRLGDIFTIGLDAMSSKIDASTGAMLVQLGDSTGNETDSDSAEVWQQPGLASLPAPPTPGSSSCQALGIRRTDRDLLFAFSDKRASKIYGKMKPGETCVFATVGQARQLFKKDGHIVTYTTDDNTPTGKTHAVTLGPDGFQVVTKYGALSIDEFGINLTLANGQGALNIQQNGTVKLMGVLVSVLGQVVAVSGATATCLGPSAVPAVGPGASSVLHGATGPGAPSTNVFCSS